MKNKLSLFLFHFDPQDVKRLDQLTPSLSEQDQAELASLKSEKRRQAYLLSRSLLVQVLKHFFDTTDLNLKKSEFGKPFLMQGPSFSLSHTHSSIALAVSRSGEVGIDVEAEDPRRDIEGIVRNYGSASDRDHFSTITSEEKVSAFFKTWTMKEAFGKALGRGLNANLQELQLLFARKSFFHPESNSPANRIGHFYDQGHHFGVSQLLEPGADIEVEVMRVALPNNQWSFTKENLDMEWLFSIEGD